MTDLDTIKAQAKWQTVLWMILCAGLLIFITLLILDNQQLQEELAKPLPPLTIQQKHQVITEYLQTMDGETKYALREQIGCKD